MTRTQGFFLVLIALMSGQECPACAEAGRICYHDERAA